MENGCGDDDFTPEHPVQRRTVRTSANFYHNCLAAIKNVCNMTQGNYIIRDYFFHCLCELEGEVRMKVI